MNKIHAITRSIPVSFEKKAFYILVGVIALFLVAYVYLVNQTVWNIVSRKNITKEISNVAGEVASLESSYMALSGSITLDHAYTLGFQDINNAETTFVNSSVLGMVNR